MTPEQYEILREKMAAPSVITSKHINRIPRTLVYGYTQGRETFHLYINDKEEFVRVVYYVAHHPSGPSQVLFKSSEAFEEIPVEQCLPDCRCYPARCDYGFMDILRARGAHIPFTRDFTREYPGLFHGELRDSDRHLLSS